LTTYEFTPVTATCPICNGDAAKRLWQTDASAAAQNFLRRDTDPDQYARLRQEIIRLWGKDTCEFVQCDNCSFVFAHPFVAGRENFYSIILGTPSYPQDRFEFRKTAETLRALRAAPGTNRVPQRKLLEIGAGDGAFVRRLIGDGFNPQEIVCTEFSDDGLQAIQRLGVECFKADVRDYAQNAASSQFTNICMFQTLEHLDDLDSLWSAFSKLAAPGANLFVSVPAPHWVAFQEQYIGLMEMPPNHIGRWNARAFSEIGGRHGWKLVDHALEPCTRFSLWKTAAMLRFGHARQVRGSLTDRTTRVSNRSLRRICSIPLLSLWCLWAIPSALSTSPQNMGGTQWAHLRRNAGQ
jgi:SAM-dependent methyltransferase